MFATKSVPVKQKIGFESIDDNGCLIKADGSKIMFFKVEPSNLAVLSETSINAKVMNLAMLAKTMGDMQIIALDDRENYSEIRKYLRNRIDEETSSQIRYILEQEELYIKTIEADSSAARLFVICFRITPQNETREMNQLVHFRALASQSNMSVYPMGKEAVKKMLAVYFKHDTTSETFPDIDGIGHYSDVDFDRIHIQYRNGTLDSDDESSMSLPTMKSKEDA